MSIGELSLVKVSVVVLVVVVPVSSSVIVDKLFRFATLARNDLMENFMVNVEAIFATQNKCPEAEISHRHTTDQETTNQVVVETGMLMVCWSPRNCPFPVCDSVWDTRFPIAAINNQSMRLVVQLRLIRRFPGHTLKLN